MKNGRRKSESHKRNISLSRSGDKNPMYKGGECLDSYGYLRVLFHGHPNANSRGYVTKHRLVMSESLGRALLKSEHVHHINGDRTDNRIENLQVMTRSQHMSHEAKKRNKNWVLIKNRTISCPCCGTEIKV